MTISKTISKHYSVYLATICWIVEIYLIEEYLLDKSGFQTLSIFKY